MPVYTCLWDPVLFLALDNNNEGTFWQNFNSWLRHLYNASRSIKTEFVQKQILLMQLSSQLLLATSRQTLSYLLPHWRFQPCDLSLIISFNSYLMLIRGGQHWNTQPLAFKRIIKTYIFILSNKCTVRDRESTKFHGDVINWTAVETFRQVFWLSLISCLDHKAHERMKAGIVKGSTQDPDLVIIISSRAFTCFLFKPGWHCFRYKEMCISIY